MPIGREEWIEAALKALSKEGVQGVRVEALARRLKVTKGSFYWHFKDRADLLDSLVAEWELETDRLVGEARQERTPVARLERFLALVKGTGDRIPDAAIFMWARKDPRVAQRVVRTERNRIAFIVSILEGMGVDPDQAELRAEVAYMAFTGMSDRLAREPGWRERRDYLLDHIASVFLEAPQVSQR